MKLNIILQQINKKGNVSFASSLLVDVKKVSDASKTIAEFSKDIVVLESKNRAIGMSTAICGIKKSLPMQLRIESVHKNGQTRLSLNYRNYGKFVREANESNISTFLKDNIEFTQKWG